MAYIPIRMYDGQPGTTDTLLVTVPPSESWIIKEIMLTNTDAVSKKITIGFPSGTALAAANQRVPNVSISGNSFVVIDMTQVLLTGETIRGLQETATAISVLISGVKF